MHTYMHTCMHTYMHHTHIYLLMRETSGRQGGTQRVTHGKTWRQRNRTTKRETQREKSDNGLRGETTSGKNTTEWKRQRETKRETKWKTKWNTPFAETILEDKLGYKNGARQSARHCGWPQRQQGTATPPSARGSCTPGFRQHNDGDKLSMRDRASPFIWWCLWPSCRASSSDLNSGRQGDTVQNKAGDTAGNTLGAKVADTVFPDPCAGMGKFKGRSTEIHHVGIRNGLLFCYFLRLEVWRIVLASFQVRLPNPILQGCRRSLRRIFFAASGNTL